jgi:hypothetical protein
MNDSTMLAGSMLDNVSGLEQGLAFTHGYHPLAVCGCLLLCTQAKLPQEHVGKFPWTAN